MTYIYDIVLNFNTLFYEFFEWEDKDKITIIKKIPVIKVDSSLLDDLFNKKIIITDDFLTEINSKCEIIENKHIKSLKYACLFTDTYRVIGVLFNSKCETVKVSDLLLSDQSEVLNISKRTNLKNISYNIVGIRNNNSFLTRKEIKIRDYLLNELSSINNKKDYNKLEYLYFEFFNKIPDNNIDIYNQLTSEIKNNITNSHLKLYKLLKLIHQ